MSKVKQQDLFMQWYPIEVTLDAADTTTLTENQITTGLSIRGEYAWLIHRIEYYFDALYLGGAVDNRVDVAVSVAQGAAAMPAINDPGVIHKLSWAYAFGAAGVQFFDLPRVWSSMPPTIIAAPTLSVYANTVADFASYQGQSIQARLGYTTIPIDQKLYLEIAETFERL